MKSCYRRGGAGAGKVKRTESHLASHDAGLASNPRLDGESLEFLKGWNGRRNSSGKGEDGREEQRRKGDEEGEEEKRKRDEQSFLPGGNKQATLSQSSAPARLRPLFGLVAFPFWRPVLLGKTPLSCIPTLFVYFTRHRTALRSPVLQFTMEQPPTTCNGHGMRGDKPGKRTQTPG